MFLNNALRVVGILMVLSGSDLIPCVQCGNSWSSSSSSWYSSSTPIIPTPVSSSGTSTALSSTATPSSTTMPSSSATVSSFCFSSSSICNNPGSESNGEIVRPPAVMLIFSVFLILGLTLPFLCV